MHKNLRFILPSLYLLVVFYLIFAALNSQTGDNLFNWLPLLFSSFPGGFLLALIFLDAGDIGFMVTVAGGVMINIFLLYHLGKWISRRFTDRSSNRIFD